MKDESFISPGQGVPKTPEGPPSTRPTHPDGSPKVDEEAAEPEVVTKQGKIVWFDTPFFEDQLLLSEKLCKVLPPVVKVFNTSVDADLKIYNEILAKTIPAGAPQIIIEETDRQFHNGAFIVYLRYSQVQYKHLVKESKP